jgi:chromosome partitioning protein
MGMIYSFCNQKGGVGKTTSAVNLAYLTSSKGFNTLLVDMDAQGNATSGVGLDKDEVSSTSYQLLVDNLSVAEVVCDSEFDKLSVVVANSDLSGADLELFQKEEREFILKKVLESAREKYDYIFIDCPPSLGLVTINCLVASDYIIIPLQCEYYALEGLGQLLRTFQLVKENLHADLELGGVILTMADFRTNLTQQVIEEVKSHFNEKVFTNVIPRAVKLSEAPSFGKPAVLYDSQNKASKAYVALGNEFVKRFSKKDQGKEAVKGSQNTVQAVAAAKEIKS